MYQYNEIDQRIVDERVAEFRDQVARRLSGELTEDEFRPLRLMNGLYLQRHAYMLRVAIPYGLLSTAQVRMLAHIARRYDKGFGHITTRQNIQYNWPRLADVPDILADLASVEMHAIQTSGNCVRNVTADQFSGVAADEVADPRPWCELMRQWSTFHPEFSYLPRKFKIAFSGCKEDNAAVAAHDIGFFMVRNEAGELGFECLVGGGLGRTPVIGQVIRDFVPQEDLLTYTEAILRVYNLQGDRENKYRARIKILVKTLGLEGMQRQVEAEFAHLKGGPSTLTQAEIDRVSAFFEGPVYAPEAAEDPALASEGAFGAWLDHNVKPHRVEGYHIVIVPLKHPEVPPGDITDTQLEVIADLADAYSFGQVRTTHEQNLMLTDVRRRDLRAVWEGLEGHNLAVPNAGTLADMICCPGLDYCALANAGSIAIARSINERFDALDHLYDLGELKLKMSGCINACGHHHVGHIGILGINKRGEEWYQIMLGGSAGRDASLGRWIGPAVSRDAVPDALERILEVYVEQREEEERFLDTVRRIGLKPFSDKVYDNA